MAHTFHVAVGSLLLVACAVEPTQSAQDSLETPLASVRHVPNVTRVELEPSVPPSCSLPSGWLPSKVAIDPSVSAIFAAAIDPLLMGHPPFAVGAVEAGDGSYWVRASGTVPNGTSLVFPPQYPSAQAPMTLDASGFAVLSPIASSWIDVVDGNNVHVWIPILQATVHASFVAGSCFDVTDGVLDAIVPASASDLVVATALGKITVGTLLGAYTVADQTGWRVRMSFDAQPAGVVSF